MNKRYTLNDVEIQKKGLKSFNYWATIAVLPSQKKITAVSPTQTIFH